MHWVDGLVLAGYLLATVAFGLWVGGRQKDSADFTVGGRDLPWWALMVSIVATETSTVTFLSVPGLVFVAGGDFAFLQLPLGYVIGRLLVATLLLPQFFAGSFVSAYQVLHDRFGGAVGRLASALFVVTRSLADGLRLFLSAIVVQAATGLDLNLSIAVLGAVTVLFTAVGGIRAVVWTDLVQFVVYMLGAGIAAWMLLGRIDGGLGDLLAAHPDKLRVFDLGFDLTRTFTLWAGVLGGTFVALASHGADQLMVQRYLCARSRRDAALALGLSGPVVLLQFAFFLFVGLLLFGFYLTHQPSVEFGAKPGDEAFARFIVDEMPPGLLGLVLGAVFSAALSTLSSSINSLATAAVHDLWVPAFSPQATDPQRLRYTRIATVLFGAVQVAVGIAGQGVAGNVITSVLSIQSFTTGVVLGVFFLARFAPGAARFDATVAFVVGLIAVTCVWLFTAIAWPWYAVIGSLGTLVAGYLCRKLRR